MEQRKRPRFAVRVPVSFAEEQVEGDGEVCNLSASGCAVECETTVPTGRYVNMLLCLSEESGPISIDVATVRWSTAQGFGAEFMWMSGDSRNKLQHFIDGLTEQLSNRLTHETNFYAFMSRVSVTDISGEAWE